MEPGVRLLPNPGRGPGLSLITSPQVCPPYLPPEPRASSLIPNLCLTLYPLIDLSPISDP